MERKTIEIASYPKSGSTWVRNLISEVLGAVAAPFQVASPPDIHEHPDVLSRLPYIRVNGQEIRFYKSHIPDNYRANPDCMVYIYRHPLDILLSALNHHARRGNSWPFIDGEPKTVEQITSENQMDYYFERFLDDLGGSLWPQMLGDLSNIQAHTTFALSRCTAAVRYEDLFHRRGEALGAILQSLAIPIPENLDDIFAVTDRKTKYSGNPFFWKAREGARNEFLDERQISRFESRHADWLRELGYLSDDGSINHPI